MGRYAKPKKDLNLFSDETTKQVQETMDVLVQTRDLIIKDFSPAYMLNDGGHRLPHFKQVEELAHRINIAMGYGYRPYLILLFAYLHDLFSWSRVNHHLMSERFVMTSDHEVFKSITVNDKIMLAKACLQHRASFKGTYYSHFSQLCASADRGIPTDVVVNINRGIAFRQHYGNMTIEEAIPSTIAHLNGKYGRDGYAKYPPLYKHLFQNQIEERYRLIEELQTKDVETIRRLIDG